MINKKPKYNTKHNNNGLDNIVNNSQKDNVWKKYGKQVLTGVGASALGIGSIVAQNNSTDIPYAQTTQTNSKYAQETPYHVIKAGTSHSFNNGRDPNGTTYFLVRANYDTFMDDLNSGHIDMETGKALELYQLMDDVRNRSIFDQVGIFNEVDGEELSKVVSQQLGRLDRVNSKNRIATTDGEWDAEETSYIGNLMKEKGYDRMWFMVIRQSEGLDPKTGRYTRYSEPNLILFDAENYNGKIAKEDKTKQSTEKKETLYISPGVFGFYAGAGGDYTKEDNVWTPQVRLGITTPKVNFGIKGGYSSYMRNFLQEFPNEQDNGWTKINTDKDIELLQIGPEIGFNVHKNVELCIGAQNNIRKVYTTETTEQQNINPFTGEERYFKVESGPELKTDSYWTIDPGAKLKFRWFGLGINVKYDPKKNRIDGGQGEFNIYF